MKGYLHHELKTMLTGHELTLRRAAVTLRQVKYV